MTLSNSQAAAAFAAAKAAVAADKASASLDTAVAGLRSAGFVAADIAGDGRFFADFQRICAETALNAKQLATWGDDSLAQGKTVGGKRVDTERGKLIKRVNSIVRRVRDKLKEPAAKGARTTKTPTQRFFDTVDDYVKRFSADNASDTFDFDPIAARGALVAMMKLLK